jgi:hypothetical protein
MYFINIKQLKEDIIEDDFGDGKQFIYFFVFLILNTIFIEISGFIPLEDITFLDYFNSLSLIVITIVGTYLMYKGNGSEKGKDFIGRYLAITWVVFIRFLIPVLLLSIIVLLIYSYTDILSDFYFEVLGAVIFIMYMLLAYFYSYKHIVHINNKMIEV